MSGSADDHFVRNRASQFDVEITLNVVDVRVHISGPQRDGTDDGLHRFVPVESRHSRARRTGGASDRIDQQIFERLGEITVVLAISAVDVERIRVARFPRFTNGCRNREDRAGKTEKRQPECS